MTTVSIHNFPHIPVNKRAISLRRPVFGIGINDAVYVTKPTVDNKQLICPYYLVWRDMLSRAYSQRFHKQNPTYSNVVVCNKWLKFSTFRAWMVKQDWQGKQLDKDIRIVGNRMYSPAACQFVTQAINCLFNCPDAARGLYPTGVHKHKDRQRFIATIKRYGKRKQLGTFNTAEEAHAVYIKGKNAYVREVAMQQPEPLRSELLQPEHLSNMPTLLG